MSKRYSSAKLTALVTAGSIALFAPQPADAATGYDAMIRPGVMVGSRSNSTDFFADLFIPLAGSERGLVYINPHLRFDDNSGNEQNIGIGFRRFFSGDTAIFGMNLFYDSMESEWNNRFDQWGVGAELLTNWFDIRANYYKPISDTIQDVPVLSSHSFTSTSLVAHLGKEEALEGFDAEVGAMIPGISNVFETRAFVGGYWYDSTISNEDPQGFRGRLEMKLSKLVHLEVEYRNDDVLGDVTYFGGYLDIPFSFENGFGDAAAFGKGARTLKERMTQKVIRDRHVVTIAGASEAPGDTDIIADMIYVNKDNSEDENQDGSLEHPWESVNRAADQDSRWYDPEEEADPAWVYVFGWEGDDDTEDNFFGGTSVYLNNGMKLWGEGFYHPLYKLGGTGGASDPDLNPILDGEGANFVVGLADNNEIMGLTIQGGFEGIHFDGGEGSSNPYVEGEGMAITGTNIHDNIIRWNGGITSGIHIENYFDSDYWNVSGETMNFRIANNEIYENSGDGIYLRHTFDGWPDDSLTGVTLTNEITGNLIYGNGGKGGNAVDVKNEINGPGFVGVMSDGEGGILEVDGEGTSYANTFHNIFSGNIVADTDGEGNYTTGHFGDHAVKIQNVLTTNVQVLRALFTLGSLQAIPVDGEGALVMNNVIDNDITNNTIIHDGEGLSEWHNGNAALYVLNWLRTDDDDVTFAGNMVTTDVSGNDITQDGEGYAAQVRNIAGTPGWTRSADNLLIENNTFATTLYDNDLTQNSAADTWWSVIEGEGAGFWYPMQAGAMVENGLVLDSRWTDDAWITGNDFDTTYDTNRVNVTNAYGGSNGLVTGNYALMMNGRGDDNGIDNNTFDTMYIENSIGEDDGYGNMIGGIEGYGDGIATANALIFDADNNNHMSGNAFDTTYERNFVTLAHAGYDDEEGSAAIWTVNGMVSFADGEGNSLVNNDFATTYDTNTLTAEEDYSGGIAQVTFIESYSDNLYVADTDITTTLTGNIIDTHDWEGVWIENYIELDWYDLFNNIVVNTDFTGGNDITTGYGGSDWDAVSVENHLHFDNYGGTATNISFSTTFSGEGNEIKVEGEGDGIYIFSDIDMYDSNNAVTSYSHTVDIADVTITANSGDDGIDIEDELDAENYSNNVVGGLTFNNTLTGNTISGFGDENVAIYHYLDYDDYGYGGGSIAGVTYTDTFVGNTISDAGWDGVDIESYQDIYFNYGGSVPWNTFLYTAVFTDNTIFSNGGDGIDIEYGNSDGEGSEDWAGHTVIMEGNVVTDNGDDGVVVDYGNGWLAVDLGGGGGGSAGFNSFYGNDDWDVYVDADQPVSAVNNWWGTDGFNFWSNSALDYTPWLTSDPNPDPLPPGP